MSQYNIFQAIPLSFYSKELYRDVANWGGKAFGYLFVLIALVLILPVILIQKTMNENYPMLSQQYVQQIPVLTFKNGEVSTPENRPYLIKQPGTDNVYMIIDTSGAYTNLDQSSVSALLTDTKFIVNDEGETRTYQIPTDFNRVIDPVVVNEHVKKYLSYAWILLYLLGVLFFYLYRIIQALVYSVIGKIYAYVTNVPLTFRSILPIAMVAVTPTIIVSTVFRLFSIQFRLQLFFYFILTMFYLFYGIAANKNKDKI